MPYRPVVLVVDDESVIADTLAEILTRSGYTGVAEYDGDSALETALLMPPEMLITDVVLPGHERYRTRNHDQAYFSRIAKSFSSRDRRPLPICLPLRARMVTTSHCSTSRCTRRIF